MTKVDKDKKLKLIVYLRDILDETNKNGVLESIVDKDIDKLWKFVVSHKLLAHNLEKLRVDDVELAFLVGEFLGSYHAIENLLKLYAEKNEFEINMEELIRDNVSTIDLLSEMFVTPAVSEQRLMTKYKEDNIRPLLHDMSDKKVVSKVEGLKERYYMLTSKSRKYMKENYFVDYEEENHNEEINNIRSRALHLLREENKKESE